VAVTAGYMDAAAREELYTFMDAANVDLKALTEEFYKRLCTGHLGAVIETLEYLKYRTRAVLHSRQLAAEALARWLCADREIVNEARARPEHRH
jgi:pyruvate-formate lyase-activating enzyme